ncbi:histidinol-phosphatase HisJ family protein [Acetohalobium arabaticum]|uniref:Histidinol-phosphatase n=1 Tax=Acetohalobium arabaticum (strain ATCC 49924 / DSM 5501 / Z-7288) TaxID=574087 RepID=D9QS92_ACEAZ|nr:histidinol-phosphatase HisJ family protein [Acetohalobium arabaticum]ADL13383.1 histidinol phosphate phosphatase HisJ family [Acetohalobium arabaticum DSM 5501]
MLVDYHVHPIAHDDGDHSKDNLRKFVKQAKKKGIKEVGIADHNRYHNMFQLDNIQVVNQEFNDVELKFGIEMDYTPGKEEEIADFLTQFNFDFVIGSIHYLGDWMFDHPDYIDEYNNRDIDEVYERYFNYLSQAARSGLFDIIGHLDLIKVFDFHPQSDILEYVGPALQAIAKEKLCIELNTNGLNKPVEEIYPSRKILEEAYKLEIPVTLSSDAHISKRVGENLDSAQDLLKDIGYEKIATFKDRQRKLVSI